MFIAERLKLARLNAGYTPGRLAELSGIHEKAIFKYERGTVAPGAENLKKLAVALEITTDYLLFEHAKPDGIPKVQDPSLYERYLVLEALDDDDKKAAVTLLDSLIARRQLKNLAKKI